MTYEKLSDWVSEQIDIWYNTYPDLDKKEKHDVIRLFGRIKDHISFYERKGIEEWRKLVNIEK
jgi:hypothetical protein